MPQLNNLPSFEQKFVVNGINNKDWYFFFAGLYSKLAPALEIPIVVGASPFTYYTPTISNIGGVVGGSVIVSGGTVSDISFSRNGTTFYTVGQISGMFTLSAQDRLRITYTVTPTMTFVPT